jgi:hypothetical protein
MNETIRGARPLADPPSADSEGVTTKGRRHDRRRQQPFQLPASSPFNYQPVLHNGRWMIQVTDAEGETWLMTCGDATEAEAVERIRFLRLDDDKIDVLLGAAQVSGLRAARRLRRPSRSAGRTPCASHRPRRPRRKLSCGPGVVHRLRQRGQATPRGDTRYRTTDHVGGPGPPTDRDRPVWRLGRSRRHRVFEQGS